MALFDSEFLSRLEYLSLVSRQMFSGSLMAQRRTMELGGGLEFSDHRQYTQGDDFRHLDWNVFARHDELLLKRFQEEEDLHVYILLDMSRSMDFGAPTKKHDLARRLAAALAYIALADLDRVAVWAFTDELRGEFPLTRGKDRILLLLRFLEELEVHDGETGLDRVVESFLHRSPRRGVCVVISDLFDVNGFERGLDLLRHRGFEPHLVQVYDRAEENPELLGDIDLIDVETGLANPVTVTEAALKAYRREFVEFQERVARYARGSGLGWIAAEAHSAFDDVVLKMMRRAGIAR